MYSKTGFQIQVGCRAPDRNVVKNAAVVVEEEVLKRQGLPAGPRTEEKPAEWNLRHVLEARLLPMELPRALERLHGETARHRVPLKKATMTLRAAPAAKPREAKGGLGLAIPACSGRLGGGGGAEELGGSLEA